MTGSLEGKTAIVTGGAKGIGRSCCFALARAGAKAAVWDLDGKGAEDTVAQIRAEGFTAQAYRGDASARRDIDAILATIRSDLGPVTILVNNAAVADFRPFLEITDEILDRICRTNLLGPFILTREVMPDMVAAGWGRVISISSASAQQGTRLLSHYGAAKGGIMAMTRTLAMEFADQGITVNNISPSFIRTPMAAATGNDLDTVMLATPMKRAGTPEDIAAMCAFLASDAAGYVTGQTLGVNGGLVLS
jgi:2-hydroxycyclohexanecarboxyl-CoA dehydrogenase